MKKILVFGGSFNPPTTDHIKMIEHVKDEYDIIYVIPSYHHRFKSNNDNYNHRLEMTKIAYQHVDNVIVGDLETANENGSMYNLIGLLRENHQCDDFYILIGEDCAMEITRWFNYEQLLNENKFIIFGRDNRQYNSAWYKKEPHKFIDWHGEVSSTLFRDTLNPEYVSESVYGYIKSNFIYN